MVLCRLVDKPSVIRTLPIVHFSSRLQLNIKMTNVTFTSYDADLYESDSHGVTDHSGWVRCKQILL